MQNVLDYQRVHRQIKYWRFMNVCREQAVSSRRGSATSVSMPSLDHAAPVAAGAEGTGQHWLATGDLKLTVDCLVMQDST